MRPAAVVVGIGLALGAGAALAACEADAAPEDAGPDVVDTTGVRLPHDLRPEDGFGEIGVSLRGIDGVVRIICTALAETSAQHSRGLMEVQDFGHLDGMLFRYPHEVQGPFWMYNTPTPLTIAFFDSEGGLVSSAEMEPCGPQPDCPRYHPAGPYRWALEVPRDGAGEYGFGPGAGLAEVDAAVACPA